MEREGGEIVGHRHPPAYRFNAGQKMIYWIVVLGGGAIAASGYLLMFPFYLTECVNLSTPMAKTIGLVVKTPIITRLLYIDSSCCSKCHCSDIALR